MKLGQPDWEQRVNWPSKLSLKITGECFFEFSDGCGLFERKQYFVVLSKVCVERLG